MLLILTADGELVSPTEVVYLALGLLMIVLGRLVCRRSQNAGRLGYCPCRHRPWGKPRFADGDWGDLGSGFQTERLRDRLE